MRDDIENRFIGIIMENDGRAIYRDPSRPFNYEVDIIRKVIGGRALVLWPNKTTSEVLIAHLFPRTEIA
ncbi:MAG: hypothetical protein LC676_10775 [Loktanella sp.]|nr:hypothetical protein [Loktanella sp.]